MTKKEKAIVIEKRIECILGIILLIIPIIAVFCFLLDWIDITSSYNEFVTMRNLDGDWTYHSDQGVSTSPAPIFIGLIALAGAYLVKDSFRFIFLKDSDNSN